MPLLTVTNLSTSDLTIQDPTGMSSLSLKVPGSGAVTDHSVTAAELAAIEPQLNALQTASTITWTLKNDTLSVLDDTLFRVTTALTTPHTAARDAEVIITALTSPAAVSVVLSASAPVGHMVTVIDGTGDASSNNVTITVASAGTVNGGASFVINDDAAWAILLKTGTNAWKAVSSSALASFAAGGSLTGSYPNPTLVYGSQVTGDVTSSAAAEASHHIDVTFQLKDLNNVNLASAALATVWISDTALAAPTGTVPDGGVTVQTGTEIIVDTTDALLRAVTSAAGVLVIRATESTAKSFFVNIAVGSVTESKEITFAG